MLPLRRRYQYPCADIVSGRPALDRALDSALAAAHPLHRRPRLAGAPGEPTIVTPVDDPIDTVISD